MASGSTNPRPAQDDAWDKPIDISEWEGLTVAELIWKYKGVVKHYRLLEDTIIAKTRDFEERMTDQQKAEPLYQKLVSGNDADMARAEVEMNRLTACYQSMLKRKVQGVVDEIERREAASNLVLMANPVVGAEGAAADQSDEGVAADKDDEETSANKDDKGKASAPAQPVNQKEQNQRRAKARRAKAAAKAAAEQETSANKDDKEKTSAPAQPVNRKKQKRRRAKAAAKAAAKQEHEQEHAAANGPPSPSSTATSLSSTASATFTPLPERAFLELRLRHGMAQP
ncbi:Uu.00g070350.m01.CDS01 [Anthostomella pinea]|uniref:Uu.00g070350.m01.CDS01 n=1 Tax=Anthostomella pinea TaxID=933095 RepID=A0AAI8VVB6_9PEZI|nr:Uu.00g070350.m01.CDS01 [Anthostomella pinea]